MVCVSKVQAHVFATSSVGALDVNELTMNSSGTVGHGACMKRPRGRRSAAALRNGFGGVSQDFSVQKT